MAQTDSKSCNKLNSFRIGAINKRTWVKAFWNFFSLKTETISEFLRLGLFHSTVADQNKQIFEKVMLSLNKENIAHRSCCIWRTSYINEIKKVFQIKETEFSLPTTKLKVF